MKQNNKRNKGKLIYYFASDDFSGINYYVPVPCFRASLGTTEQRMSASTTVSRARRTASYMGFE
jgi:hypothetical protein